jgi:hypothetical protein
MWENNVIVEASKKHRRQEGDKKNCEVRAKFQKESSGIGVTAVCFCVNNFIVLYTYAYDLLRIAASKVLRSFSSWTYVYCVCMVFR